MSRGHLCVKGRYAFDFVSAPDRITQPMIRKGDKWQQVTWDNAVSFIAESLQRISESMDQIASRCWAPPAERTRRITSHKNSRAW